MGLEAMKRFIRVLAGLTTAVLAGQQMSADAQIAEAVSPLPESARAGATIITHDAKGNPKVVRQGNNGITCEPSRALPLIEGISPGGEFNVQCYGKGLSPVHQMMVKLLVEGRSGKEVATDVQAAVDSGRLQPPPAGTMGYYKFGKTGADARVLWILYLPNATAESLGLPTKSGQGSPWMMLSGTPRAHVMLPQTEAGLAAGTPK
jgi:hypothetical protein